MLSGFLAVIVNKMPPSTVRGELATPCILVWIGKMESGFTCILAKRDLGITVSWAPVSHTDSVGLDLPGCFPADNLGIAKLSSEYARLSMEKVTGKVGLGQGFVLIHPLTRSWTWWGSGRLVTGPVCTCLRWLTAARRSSAEVGG